MGTRFVLESPAPPPAVLAAIREEGGEWRESAIPSELRADRPSTLETPR